MTATVSSEPEESDAPVDATPAWWQPESWARWHATRIVAERGFLLCCGILIFGGGFLFGLAIAINHYNPQ